MIIIIAASTNIDLDALNTLIAEFDHAADEAERQRIAEEVERFAGDKARSAVRQRLGNFGLSQDEINSLATEAIDLALRGVGRVHLRRSDVVPEELVRQMNSTALGQRLMALLSPSLQQALQAPYLKQDVEHSLIRELNALLDRDLAQDLGIPGPPASQSAVQRTIDNAQMLASAFPGVVGETEKPPLHFMGYLTKDVIPTLGQRVKREKGGAPEEVLRTWRAIRPVVEDLRASSGGAGPTAEEVRKEWLDRMNSRYFPMLKWWTEQLQKVGRPFKIDHNSFADAKDILVDRGYDRKLWEGPDAEYHLPKDFLKPFSINAVERAMSYQQRPANRPLPAQPAAPAVSEESGAAAPSWAMQMGQVGRGGELYRAIVEKLYPDRGSVERRLGEFIAENPNPTDTEVTNLLDDLAVQDPEAAEYLRSAWRETVRQIDRRVTETLRDPRTVGSIAEQFGFSPSEVGALRDHVRRVIFGRNNRLLSIVS